MASETRTALIYGAYDFSNSGYALTFQSFLFPILLSAAYHGSGSSGTVWGTVVTLSSLAAIVVGPFVGRYSDHVGKGPVFVWLVVSTGVLAVVCPLVFQDRLWLLALGFIVFNTTFELSQSLYDSFLLDFRSTAEGMTRLSTFAWGFGYLGGSVSAIVYLLLNRRETPAAISLAVLAGLFLVLSIPAMIGFTRANPRRKGASLHFSQILAVKNPVPWRDIVVYWLIADSVGAVLYFTPLYMREELKLSTKELGIIILGTQLVAFPLTVVMGRVANRWGIVRTIRLSLIVWLCGLTGLFFARSIAQLIPAMLALALVFGSTQALMRSHFAARLSLERSGEGFGFFAIAQKSAAVFAPGLIALMSLVTGSLRPTYLVVALLIAVALLLSRRIPEADPASS
jgi:UMF1 family MFS transporter